MNRDLMHSLWAGALYFLIANPVTYQITQSILGGLVTIADPITGAPTQLGTVVHGGVYALITYMLMQYALRKERREEREAVVVARPL